MAPLDPTQLLKALNPLLGPTGAIMGTTEASRIASLMKDANKIVSKCVYLNILKLETPNDAMERFLSIGGWDTLNEWLQDFKEGENDPLLSEILKVYKTLPVTVEILKKNNAAKTIKQLCKSDNESVKTLANNIFDEWMKKVKNNNNNSSGGSSSSDPKLKKKKKDKERKEDEKGESKNSERSDSKSEKGDSKSNDKSDSKNEKGDASRNSDKSDSKSDKSDGKSDKSKSRDSKSSHHHSSHHRHQSGDKRSSSSQERKASEDISSSSSSSSSSKTSAAVSEEVVTVRQGSGLKLHIKLGSDKEKTEKTNSSERKRPSTVKVPPSKFRSTGLEEETVPSKLTKLSEKQPPPKRTSTDSKSEPPVKKSRLHMPPPLSVPSPTAIVTSTGTTPSSTSPTSPGEVHGKIKLIPARPKPVNHSIHDSSGFMDSLIPARTYGAFKKKKKAMAAAANGVAPQSPSTPTGKPPSTPPSPLSPTSAVAKSLPAVPSFYKDTQADPEPSPEKERTPSPVEDDKSTEPTEPEPKDETKDDTTPVQMEIDDDAGDYDPEDKERSLSPDSLAAIAKETKGLLTTGPTRKKKKKKNVSWKEDIKEVFFFELDEDERVNVNKIKNFDQAKKNEMINDRKVIETSRRLVNDNMMEQIVWYRPKLIAGTKEIDYGKESTEKNIQKVREQCVLQALYFNRDMLPDGPQEPDPMHEEVVETKTIPLEDVSGGDEFLYNYDQHPEAVKNAPATDKQWQNQQQQQQQQPPHGPPMSGPPNAQPPMPPPLMMPNMPMGLNLPPELMGLIAQIQNMPQDQSGPVMAQVQQMLNNIMLGSSDKSFEFQQLQQMMSSQMGMPPDGMIPGPPPLMGPPMGMPPNGPPMGPRTGLLGNAPPGFMPQRPMGPGPPNRFGGPGPGQQGNWNDQQGNWNENQQGNWNDGPGGSGRQNNNWGSRRRGSGSRGRGRPVNLKNVCRHFASGSCKLGSDCGFLHPGINGPPLKNEQSVDS